MLGGLRRVTYTGVLAALTIVVLAGCQATGGGYIPSTIPGEKATFAFNGKCTNTTLEDGRVQGVVEGQLQYNDRAADVKFHAELERLFILVGSSTPCEDAAEFGGDTAAFTGTYRVPGGPNEEGEERRVDLTVIDGGEPGINGDVVEIFLIGGPYDGYFNSGLVQGGNVQVHCPEC